MPIGLGFAWLILLRFFAKTVVYSALIAIDCVLFAVAAYLFVVTGLAQSVLTDLLSSNTTKIFLDRAMGGMDEFGASNASSGDAGSGDVSSGPDTAFYESEGAIAISTVDRTIGGLVPDSLQTDAAAHQKKNPLLWELAAWGCLVLFAVYTVLLVLWRAKIRLVASLVKEASVVIKDRPSTLVFPGITLIFSLGNLFGFVIGMLFLGTADITEEHFTGGPLLKASATFGQALAALNDTLSGSGPSAVAAPGALNTKNMVYLYFMFGFLWTNQCIGNVSWTSLSGSYCHWYFFRRDEKHRTRLPLVRSVYRVFRYHLGSIAFGSFIVAFVQLLRVVMMYVDQQTKTLQETNKMMKLAIKCLKCCLMCLEKCLKFITDYCYIYIAMQGCGFFRACIATFGLIMGEPAQLALNTLVRLILTLIQLVGIPLVCYEAVNVALTAKKAPEPMYPSVLVAIVAFIIANAFAQIFACVLDTLFVCCVRDKNEYKAAFMSDELFVAFGFDPTTRKGGGGGGDGGSEKKGGAGETTQQL